MADLLFKYQFAFVQSKNTQIESFDINNQVQSYRIYIIIADAAIN